jgi:hypothetical protein
LLRSILHFCRFVYVLSQIFVKISVGRIYVLKNVIACWLTICFCAFFAVKNPAYCKCNKKNKIRKEIKKMSDKKIVNIQLTKAKSVAAVEIGKNEYVDADGVTYKNIDSDLISDADDVSEEEKHTFKCNCHMLRKNCTRKLTASSSGCCFFCCNAHKKNAA